MIRYSYIKNRSFQNWALKTSQIDNLISQKLDAIGEYRFSEFAYNSALKLASVLRISAVEDEVEDESYKKEETDVVKFDLPGEIKTYEEPIRSSNPQDETEFLKSMINALSLGGRNIYNSLVHLSSLLKKIRSHSNSYLTARQSLIWMAFEQYYGCEAFDSDEFIQLDFPILLNRNSVLLVRKKQFEKLHKINTKVEELFLSQDKLLTKKVKLFANQMFNFNNQINVLEQQFDTLRELSKLTDVSFLGAVNAQEKKQLKGLKNLEKRLLKANKIKYKSHLDRITAIQDDLFPNKSLQERSVNFAEFYCQYGDEFIKTLKDNIHPLNNKFSIIEL